MKKIITAHVICLVVLLGSSLPAAAELDFTLHRLEADMPGPTLLVVGGIQGDEPGGFNAAALLVTNYRILKGSVWVVPNLNFISIINRSRGVHGDLNRKFAVIHQNDPEYNTITKIKKIISNSDVDVVLNLHDGSGFYRPRHIDAAHNPNRWGQCIIIDQKQVRNTPYGNLEEIAGSVVADINEHLYADEHRYHVKNTTTWRGDKEMEKTLTYFAVRNEKSSFGLETSKSFPTHTRAYYHLRALESFMDHLGISYERNFAITTQGVKNAINTNINLALYDNRIFLDVGNARKRLGYVPLKKNAELVFTPSNPLLTVVNTGKGYRVFYGNRRITRIHPEYLEYDLSIDGITMQVDGYEQDVPFGRIVDVGSAFKVESLPGYRVNVIGYTKPGVVNESGIFVRKHDIMKRFSVDRNGMLYRVEVYREKKFAGMVLVNFDKKFRNLRVAAPRKRISLVQYVQPDNPLQ